jgi:DeoR family myo-inositol catabolism operon transcriptional repressor
MIKNERIDKVLEIIREEKYITVEKLVNKLHYSPATIRRDLTQLEKLGLVKKSYGGVSVASGQPAIVREHENTLEKIRICKFASDFIKDGDVVFVDGTTTTYFLGERILKKKDVIVCTANMKLASYLCENSVPCYVCGGMVFDGIMLGGAHSCDIIEKFNFDVAFFSPGAVSEEGLVSHSENYWGYTKTVMRRSKQNILLCDNKKTQKTTKMYIGNVGMFDIVVSDDVMPKQMKDKYENTKFLVAKY